MFRISDSKQFIGTTVFYVHIQCYLESNRALIFFLLALGTQCLQLQQSRISLLHFGGCIHEYGGGDVQIVLNFSMNENLQYECFQKNK